MSELRKTKSGRSLSNIARRNKAIGREFQQQVRDLIISNFPILTLDDVRSNPSGAPGEDLLLSSLARRILKGTQHECKSREKVAMVEWMEQAAQHGKHRPVVWFKKSGKNNKVYAAVEAEFFIELIREITSK